MERTRSREVGLMRHLRSGWRFSVPRPEQGESMSRESATFSKSVGVDSVIGLTGVAQELGKRNISAWSVFAYSDPNWVVETRGGMVDRSIDYETLLTMNDAARAAEPAFRAHWVQNGDWENLSWSKMEHFGALLELGLSEWKDRQSEEGVSIVPEGFSEKLVTEVIVLNRMYRDEFREGIGDEVAWFGDFLGEMPAVPGISEETVQGQAIPRFLIARPLESREKITAAGESLSASNRRVLKWLSESIVIEISAVMPQSIESGGVMTWFAPLPFIGGDFVPGVSIDDRVWMIGTSRSLAEGFSKSMVTVGSAGETGVIFEVDLERLVSWSEEIRVANEETIDSLTDELLKETEVPEGFGSSEGLIEGLKKLKRFSYRSWLEGGKPRSRYKLEFKSSE